MTFDTPPLQPYKGHEASSDSAHTCHDPAPLCDETAGHLEPVGHAQRAPQHVALIQNDAQPVDLCRQRWEFLDSRVRSH